MLPFLTNVKQTLGSLIITQIADIKIKSGVANPPFTMILTETFISLRTHKIFSESSANYFFVWCVGKCCGLPTKTVKCFSIYTTSNDSFISTTLFCERHQVQFEFSRSSRLVKIQMLYLLLVCVLICFPIF